MPEFIPGIQLCSDFYREIVAPILQAHYPDLPYAAALIGSGSEVLGFDTPRSRDHHWGPRVMLFLNPADHAAHADAISKTLSEKLPYSYQGYSTNFSPPDPEDKGTQLLAEIESGPVNHRVEILTISGFFTDYLGIDPLEEITPLDWLTLPEQRLRTVTAGAVYHDGIGDLEAARSKLAYYPHDVWLYVLAAQWERIGQEEHFLGRTGEVDDELGSRLLGGRLVRDLMKLAFLLEKQYAPYIKWFGTAFTRLDCTADFMPLFEGTLAANSWQKRERYLIQAYTLAAEIHNSLGLTAPLPTEPRSFFGRPFQVIYAGEFAAALRAEIQDETLRNLKTPIGAVDQFVDNTDFLSNPSLYRGLKGIHELG